MTKASWRVNFGFSSISYRLGPVHRLRRRAAAVAIVSSGFSGTLTNVFAAGFMLAWIVLY
jgi:NCAIR mutase (PurE)-related protein